MSYFNFKKYDTAFFFHSVIAAITLSVSLFLNKMVDAHLEANIIFISLILSYPLFLSVISLNTSLDGGMFC